MPQSAARRLEYGDDVNRRVADGTGHAAIAVADGVSPQVVAKAAWLARTYDPDARAQLGAGVLGALNPSHLEVVAAIAPGARAVLLRQAVDGHLSVRQLKQVARLVPGAAPPRSLPPGEVKVVGKAVELASACAAAHRYANWDDRALRTLLGGPNGPVIRDLATAGRDLASRIEEVTPIATPLPQ
jgi:hypothetical protein